MKTPQRALRLVLGLLLTSAGLCAQENEEERSFSPVLKVLPVGSNLQNFSVPHYDENLKPLSLMTAGLMKVVSEERLEAENVGLTLFSPDGKITSEVTMETAYYDATRGLIHAPQEVSFRSSNPKFEATGSGAYFLRSERMAFVEGPLQAVMTKVSQDTAKEGALRGVDERGGHLGLLALFLNPQWAMTSLEATPQEWAFIEEMKKPISISPHTAMVDEETLRLRSAEKGSQSEMKQFNEKGKEDLKVIAVLAESLEKSQAQFAKKIGKPNFFLITDKAPPSAEVVKVTAADEAIPDTGKKDKDEVRVSCDGGMFTNTEEGHAVFLKNVKFEDNQGTVTCGKELKVFFSKGKKEEIQNDKAAIPAIGKMTIKDIEQIVGTGTVKLVLREEDGGPPLIATAETISYDLKTGTIILKGGFPTIYQKGKIAMEAKEKGLYIKLGEDFFASPGKWNLDFVPDFK